MKFLHSMIRVKNIEESLKFYIDFIGLKLIKKNSLEDCDLYFLGEDENDCQIELTYNYERESCRFLCKPRIFVF